MDRRVILTVTSLLSLLLLTLHISDDVVHGLDAPGPSNLIGIAIVVVLLYGIVMMRDRLVGRISVAFTGLFALGMPIIHLRGDHIREMVTASGGFFFYWTLFVLGVSGSLTVLLVIHEIIGSRRSRPRNV